MVTFIFEHAHTLNLHILTVVTDQHILTASKVYLCWFIWYFKDITVPSN
jgi:hypothetical protein